MADKRTCDKCHNELPIDRPCEGVLEKIAHPKLLRVKLTTVQCHLCWQCMLDVVSGADKKSEPHESWQYPRKSLQFVP